MGAREFPLGSYMPMRKCWEQFDSSGSFKVMQGSTSSDVLYVEDDTNNVVLFDLACQRAGVSFRLSIVGDGDEAVQRLSADGLGETSATLPALVLLDLNLPGKSGFEVLKWIRVQSSLRHLPVIIFTSSNLEQDIVFAYHLGASGYLVKPNQLSQLSQLALAIDLFWVRCNWTPRTNFQDHTGPCFSGASSSEFQG